MSCGAELWRDSSYILAAWGLLEVKESGRMGYDTYLTVQYRRGLASPRLASPSVCHPPPTRPSISRPHSRPRAQPGPILFKFSFLYY
eukprot:scaffold13207_cov111-Skeletonema_dohrnii-CCMP3373.AAC.3